MNQKREEGWMSELLKDTAEPDREEALLDQIRLMAREILELGEAERLEPDQKLFELGFRSMNVIELRTRLEEAFSMTLPVPLFFTYSTLGRLTTHLLSEAGGSGPELSLPHRKAEEASTEEIGRLSDAQAEARLLDMIADIEEKLDP